MTVVKTLIAIGNLTMQHLGFRVEVLDPTNEEIICAGELKSVMHWEGEYHVYGSRDRGEPDIIEPVARTQVTLGLPGNGLLIHTFDSDEVARVCRPQEES